MKGKVFSWMLLVALCLTLAGISYAQSEALLVIPEQAQVLPGGSVKFDVQLFGLDGAALAVEDIQWSVDPDTLGDIADDGFFIAGNKPGKGKVIVTAQFMGRTLRGEAEIQVGVIDRAVKLIIQPKLAVLSVSEQLQFTAKVVGPTGVPLPEVKIEWNVDPEELGTIDQNGLFTAGTELGHGKVIASARIFGERLEDVARVIVGPKPNCAIAGMVSDEDDLSPIADATISAHRIGLIHWVQRTQSQADGTYLLNNLIPGLYVVRAQKAGYITEFYQDVRYFNEATPLQLTEGDTLQDIDFHLNHGGAISGMIFNADTTDTLGAAHVTAELVVNRKIRFHALSNEDGSYLIQGLSTGTYVVSASKAGYKREYYQDVTNFADATHISVTEPDTVGDIDLTLEIASAIVGQVVSEETGLPIARARVSAWRLYAVCTHCRPIASTLTDDEGNYVLPVRQGKYFVTATAEGFAREFYQEASDPRDADLVEVLENQHTTGIDFTLLPLSTISGIVTEEITDTPIAGAEVIAFPAINTVRAYREPYRVTTNEDGTYLIPNVRPGTYILKAKAKDYLPEFYEEAEKLADAKPVQVGLNEQIENINFTLLKGGVITGVVVNELDNQPISHALVVAKLIGRPYKKRALTNDDGTYEIAGLVAGSYHVMAVAKGYEKEFYDNEPDVIHADSVEVVPPEVKSDIDFSLTPVPANEGAIAGFVVDKRTMLPITGAFVMAIPIRPTGIPHWDVTGPLGHYKISGLHTGKYIVMCWAAGYIGEFYDNKHNWKDADPVWVESPNTTTGIDFMLRPKWRGPYRIRGRIMARDNNQPLGNVFVYATSSEGVVGFAVSDEDGYYEIPEVPAGNYQLVAVTYGYVQDNDNDPNTSDSLSVSLQDNQDETDANITMDFDETADVSEPSSGDITPSHFELSQNYPNPFNPETTIRYQISEQGIVSLKIYNLLGQEVKLLLEKKQAPGVYSLKWNGMNNLGLSVPSGVYFLSIEVKNNKGVVFSQIKKMTLLR